MNSFDVVGMEKQRRKTQVGASGFFLSKKDGDAKGGSANETRGTESSKQWTTLELKELSYGSRMLIAYGYDLAPTDPSAYGRGGMEEGAEKTQDRWASKEGELGELGGGGGGLPEVNGAGCINQRGNGLQKEMYFQRKSNRKWNDFYHRHTTKFFIDRRWIVRSLLYVFFFYPSTYRFAPLHIFFCNEDQLVSKYTCQ